MSSSLDHKCQRCGSQYHGQICPFCTITGLDVNALLASEGLTMPQAQRSTASAVATAEQSSPVTLIDVVSNRTFPVNQPVCRFGRDISNDIVLTGDKSLSRFHFQITWLNSDFFVEDSGSRNGTFLNGSPVTAPRKILNGDIISAGMTRYRFVLGDEAAAAESNEANAADESVGHAVSEGTSVDPQAMTVAPGSNLTDLSPPPSGQSDLGPPPLKSSPEEQTDKPASSRTEKNGASENMDPLTRLFEEGQALLSSNTNNQDDAADLDSFFTAKPDNKNNHNGNGNDKAVDGNFLQFDSQKEPSVEELFQEQLRAVSAANESKPAEPVESKVTGDNGWHEEVTPSSTKPELSGEEKERMLESTSFGGDSLRQELLETLAQSNANLEPSNNPEQSDPIPDSPNNLANLANTNPDIEVKPAQAETANTSPAVKEQWPDWCLEYRITELEELRGRMTVLEDEIQTRQAELQDLTGTMHRAEAIKNRLLAGRDQQLVEAITNVFTLLGWETAANGSSGNEICLMASGKAEALVRIVCTETQPKPNEMANLVTSLSNYWCDHGVEPKGIMLVSLLGPGAPSERPQLNQDYCDYAMKKNVCLLSSLQLLGIYRRVALSNADVESIRATILGQSGHLQGFEPDA